MQQWNNLTPNFSSSNRLQEVANNQMSQAGTRLSAVGDSISAIDNVIADKKAKEEIKQKEKLMQTANRINNDAFMNSFEESIDPSINQPVRKFNKDTYAEGLKKGMAGLDPVQAEAALSMINVPSTIDAGAKQENDFNTFGLNKARLLQDNSNNNTINIGDQKSLQDIEANKRISFANEAIGISLASDPNIRQNYVSNLEAVLKDSKSTSEQKKHAAYTIDYLNELTKVIKNNAVNNAGTAKALTTAYYNKITGQSLDDKNNIYTPYVEQEKIQLNETRMKETTRGQIGANVIKNLNSILSKGKDVNARLSGNTVTTILDASNVLATAYPSTNAEKIQGTLESYAQTNETLFGKEVSLVGEDYFSTGISSLFKEAIANPYDFSNPIVRNIATKKDWEEYMRKTQPEVLNDPDAFVKMFEAGKKAEEQRKAQIKKDLANQQNLESY